MNLFYKIHLQAFNVISIVLYHRGPTFGQVLYSCQEAVVVDEGMSPPDFDLFPKLKKPLRGKRFSSIEEVSNEVTRVIRHINNNGFLTGIQYLPKSWTSVIKHNGD
jgi:hypothetical protein